MLVQVGWGAAIAGGVLIVGADSATAGMNQSPNWTYDGEELNNNLGASLGSAGDVNGDGYSDLIVGEPFYANGHSDEGRALVFLGSATGLAATPAWSWESNSSFTQAGLAVSTAGDVNGDGYDDVIVGIPEWTIASNRGRAHVFLGSPSGLSATPAWTKDGESTNGATFGLRVATAGDVNDDGYDDILIADPLYGPGTDIYGRVYLYLGSASGPSTTAVRILEGETDSSRLGIGLATAGDVNADGKDDILVGADGWDDPFHVDAGRAYCYLGSAAGGIGINPVWTLDGDQDAEFLGQMLAPAGDLDGDGYADILVGREHFDNGATELGLTQVYFGSASGPETSNGWALLGADASDMEGAAVFSAGDVNGDGYADLATGARRDENGGESAEGVVRVYLGGPSGPSDFGQPMVTLDSDLAGAEFGTAVCCAGDVNGDGFSDLAVGAPLADVANGNQAGRAYVFHGKPDDYASLASFLYEPGQATAYLGSCVRFADVNGDGYSEILVGAYGWDNPDFTEGKAFLWYGGLGGAIGAPDWSVEGNQLLASYGTVIDGAGDVNGDGYGDVIVTAPFYDGLATDDGRAYIYYGSIGGLSTTAAWSASSGQNSGRFGSSAASAGDVNGDGFGDVVIGMSGRTNGQTSEGAAILYLGSPAGLTDLTVSWEGNQVDAQNGFAVAGAGDVNGDGYDDVVSGAPFYDNGQTDEGVVFVFFGDPDGVSFGYSQILEANQAGARFGSSVASAGDVNGDGYSDVIVGAPRWANGDTQEGAIFVYLGSPSGLVTTPQRVIEGSGPNRNFGTSVACAGDVDVDGYSDVIVGAPGAGANGEGVVYLYRGLPTGTAGSPSWSRTGDGGASGGSFGWSVAGCGDIDGDGYSDIGVGDPDWTNPSTFEGRAYVFGGNRHDSNNVFSGLNRKLISYRTDFSAPIALRGISDAVDSFRFIVVGRTPAGRGDVRVAYESRPFGESWGTNVDRTPWTDSGAVLVSDGSATAIGALVSGLDGNTRYQYRVRTESDSPYFPRTPWITPHGNAATEADLRTGFDPADVATDEGISGRLRFQGAFPNPLTEQTHLRFSLEEAADVTLTLHDVTGRQVARLAEGRFDAGVHSIGWDGTGAHGRRLASGVYFARFEAVGEVHQGRVLIRR